MNCKTTVFEKQNDKVVSRHVVEQSKDLRSSQFRDMLGRVTKGQSIVVCGCRENEGIWPRLFARSCGSNLVCVRTRVKQHGPACIIGKIRHDQPDAPLSISVFSRKAMGQPTDSESRVAELSTVRKEQYLRFSQFAERSAAKAGAIAFINANPIGPPSCQPSADQYFCAWDEVLRDKEFSGQRSAFQAAEAEGCRLVIGISFEEIVPPTIECGFLTGYWWTGAALKARVITLSPEVRENGCGRLRGWVGDLPPPYVLMALVEPHGVVRHLWVHGVWSDGNHLTFASSINERQYYSDIQRSDGCIFVPLSIEALELVSGLLPQVPQQLLWHHLPDGIKWINGLATIVEVVGFKPGENEEYDIDLEKKERWYRGMEAYYGYDPFEAWRHRRPQEAFNKRQWRSPKLVTGVLSLSAVGLLKTLLEGIAKRSTLTSGILDGTHN